MTISVVIPVLHEQERINSLIEHLKGQDTLESEIIVVDGDAQGSTIANISDLSVLKLTAPKGRGSQLAAGVTAATGDIILMLHADTLLPEGWKRAIMNAVHNGAHWGAFRLGIEASDFAYRIIERSVDIRCNLFNLPYGDQGIFATREALKAIGSVPDIPIMEDVELCRRLEAAGFCFKLLPARVQTSARRWQKDGIFLRTLGNWRLLLRYFAGSRPDNLTSIYPPS